MATLNANTVVQRGFEHVVLYKGDEIPGAADLVGDHLIEARRASAEAGARSQGRRRRQLTDGIGGVMAVTPSDVAISLGASLSRPPRTSSGSSGSATSTCSSRTGQLAMGTSTPK